MRPALRPLNPIRHTAGNALLAQHPAQIGAFEGEIRIGRHAIEERDEGHLLAAIGQHFGEAHGHEVAVAVEDRHAVADRLAGEQLLRRDEARQACSRCPEWDRDRRAPGHRRSTARRSPARSSPQP